MQIARKLKKTFQKIISVEGDAVGLKSVEPYYYRLTLIRAAGGVYDFWNFEQVKLHNALSNKIVLN